MDLTDQPDVVKFPIETAAFLSSFLQPSGSDTKMGKKQGALLAMKLLQKENLGELISQKATIGTSSVSNRVWDVSHCLLIQYHCNF